MSSKFNLKSFPQPRQHGAWIMFLVPALMAVGLDIRQQGLDLILIVAFVFIFLSYQPFQRFLRRRIQRNTFDRESLLWSGLLGGTGVLLSTGMFIWFQRWSAFLFDIIIVIFLFIHLIWAIRTSTLALPVELVGVAGLTASGPMIVLFNTGTLDTVGWTIWLVNFLYFAGSLFFVKLKLRIQPSMPAPSVLEKIKWGTPLLGYTACVYFILYLLIQFYSFEKLLLFAFLPFALKAVIGVFSWYDKQLAKPSRTGFYEIFHAVIFIGIALIALRHLS